MDEIEKRHSGDSEISYQLGSFYHREQKLERAISLYQRSIDLGYDDPEVYLDRARALADLGDVDEANQDAFRALDCHGLSPRSISRALKLVNSDELPNIADSTAVVSLDIEQRIRLIALIYFENEAKRNLVLQLVHPKVNVDPASISDTWSRNEFGLIDISLGEFKLASEWFPESQDGERDIAHAFNHAMASWGKNGVHSKAAFEKVIDLYESEPVTDEHTNGANYFQCIALAYWAKGDVVKGLEFAEKAELALRNYGRTFSCWRYGYVNKKEFLKNIQEMKKFLNVDTNTGPTIFTNSEKTTINE